MLTAFYRKPFAKVCGEKTYSTHLLQACWNVATGALKMMLNEVHKVRVHASSPHLMQGPQGLVGFLHVTLQELRVLKDFKEKMIENHHLVRAAMVTYLFNTYTPKLEMDLSKSDNFLLKIKCNE